jgi:glycosyl transferase family 9 (putative heptosyltransferase)
MRPTPLQPIVIWFGRVGDMILLSALLGILHRRYGSPCYLIGAGSWPAELYATHADVGRISCLHRYTVFAIDPVWWSTVRALRARGDSPVYVCEFDANKLARIQRLLDMAGIAAERCLYITREASYRERHWIDRLVSFGHLTPPAFNAADYPWPSPAPLSAPHLEVSPEARRSCDAWLEAAGLAGRPLILVQPGNRRTMRGRRLRVADDDDKAWPLERWAALLQRVHAHMPEARIVLCGAPRETLLLEWIARATQLPAVVAAELSLPRLLALCERAHSMISVDTGPAHAAAALSLPLVVLFGGHAQAEWLARSPAGSPVIGVGGPPESRRLDEVPMERVFAAWCALPGRTALHGDTPLSPAARATAP